MVQIQSKQERSMWVSALINSIPDIAIAWIASDGFAIGPIGFVAGFVGMHCLYFYLGLKMILWCLLDFSGSRWRVFLYACKGWTPTLQVTFWWSTLW